MKECKECGHCNGEDFKQCPVCGHMEGSLTLEEFIMMGVFDDEP